jgi:heme/copper-type cytochrome/quinol oxidase subunit 2
MIIFIIFIVFIIFIAEDVVLVATRAKRIENAKQFLKENFIEIIACAARIYDLIEITLYSSIKRQKDEQMTRREEHNKILSQDETAIIHNLIRLFFLCDISSTHNLIHVVIS